MVNEWNKTAFDTMLRRRLKSGAAPVAACAGFDLDAASAYLEGALDRSHRAGYESHLAGCAACRRHLIELARLAELAPFAQAQPASMPDRVSIRGRWPALAHLKDAVAVWFNIPSWDFKWQVAGATGAAFTILITALGAQSWLRSSRPADMAIVKIAATPGIAGPADVSQPLQSTIVEVFPQNVGASAPIDHDSMPSQQGRTRVPEPHLLVGPQSGDPNLPVEASKMAMAPPVALPGEAPGVKEEARAMSAVPETGRNPARMSAVADLESKSVASYRMDSSNELPARIEAEDPVSLRPSPPRINPMDPQPAKNVSYRGRALVSKEQAKPSSESGSKPYSLSRIKNSVAEVVKRNPFKWPFSESEEKPAQDAHDSSGDESANGVVWRFRGKVFIFDRGMWIDQEYKPEMQQWRRWTLTRGSEQYKQALAGEPQLKEFFDHGPILIVWKNQIYKVLK
jgi:hypothetical protein